MKTNIITNSIANPSELPSLLAQTREQYLQFLDQPIDKLVTGAVVFEPCTDSQDQRILIIKRAPHEDYFANCFIIPSGKVDEGESIGAGLPRELFEETGLVLTKVLAQLPGMAYTTTKTVEEGGKETVLTRNSIQAQFCYRSCAWQHQA